MARQSILSLRIQKHIFNISLNIWGEQDAAS